MAGAQEVHARFPDSRYGLERDGNFHGVAFTANASTCINDHVIAYLRDGTRPASQSGADAVCAATPAPDPTQATR